MVKEERDLWWEARENTRKKSKPGAIDLAKNVMRSFRGQPTRESFVRLLNTFGTIEYPLIVDLNLYRMRDLKPYIDAGVDYFILRMGGPKQFVAGNYIYTLDPTYKPLFEQADKLGIKDRVMAYWIHVPGEPWDKTDDPIGDQVELWTQGGYMPRMIWCDFEVATQWRAGTLETITQYNLRGSLEASTAKIAKRFNKKKVGVYTARWFLDQYCAEYVTIYFDNVNRPPEAGGVGEQRPLWWAYWPQAFPKQYTNGQVAMDELTAPTADQKKKYLGLGSYAPARLWQFTSTLRIGTDTQGVDASVSMLPRPEMLAAFDMLDAPVPPDPPKPPDPTEYLTTTAFDKWVAENYAIHTHKTNGPLVP